MNIVRAIAGLMVVAFAGGWTGCKPSSSAGPAPASSSAAMPTPGTATATSATVPVATNYSLSIPTNAQPKLQTIKLWVGPEELVTELALTGIQQQTGMMFRTNMAENEAMLFVFGYPHQASFWMMNTYVPLSAAYIDPEGVILEIHKLEPLNTNSVEAATDQVQYVLETRQGWFDRHNIRTGMVIRSEFGPLKSTFTQRR